MKSIKSLFLVLICVSYSYTANHRPITFIIDNTTNQPLELILEYKIDQYYKHSTKAGTPFTPHYLYVHYIPTIAAGKQLTFSPHMNDCLPSFCFLDANLKQYGFAPAYKMIHANLAVQDYNYSFDFTETVTDNSTVKIALKDSKQATLTITQ